MADMILDGRRVHYHDGGVAWKAAQPWIALVHGAGGTHVAWQSQSRALAHAAYNVLVPDLPGHGASEDVADIRTVEDYAAWLRRLIHGAIGPAIQPKARLVLVGHSLGACIALSYASEWPDEVAGLGLVGANLEMRVNPALLKDCLENQPRAVDFITSFGHGRRTHLSSATAPGAWVLGADRALMLASDPSVLHRDFAICANWQGAVQAPKVKCPTLVVAGALDRMTPAKGGRLLADKVRGARYEVLPGVGHMLPSEAPRALLKLLQSFLAGLPAAHAA